MTNCESCGENREGAVNTLITSDATYKLCHNCLILFVNVSLTPQMFKSLINAGHDPHEFYLQGDFYDENGVCLQSVMSFQQDTPCHTLIGKKSVGMTRFSNIRSSPLIKKELNG